MYPGGMKTVTAVRNCLRVFRLVCPHRWEQLAPTDDPARPALRPVRPGRLLLRVGRRDGRPCPGGEWIARELPDSSELRRVYVGRPRDVPAETPEQAEALRLTLRERGIDDPIENAAIATRSCPNCSYPAPDWRVA